MLVSYGRLCNVSAKMHVNVATMQLSSPRPSRAFGPEFRWDNGTTATFDSRERPQLLLDPASGEPLFMSNGFITAGWSGHSFTLVAPIKNSQQQP